MASDKSQRIKKYEGRRIRQPKEQPSQEPEMVRPLHLRQWVALFWSSDSRAPVVPTCREFLIFPSTSQVPGWQAWVTMLVCNGWVWLILAPHITGAQSLNPVCSITLLLWALKSCRARHFTSLKNTGLQPSWICVTPCLQCARKRTKAPKRLKSYHFVVLESLWS